MKYTQKQLEEMSDLELSEIIIELKTVSGLWSKPLATCDTESEVFIEPIDNSDADIIYFDINKWSDMGILIELIWSWLMSKKARGYQVISVWELTTMDCNCGKLRAAAIVYILIRQGE